MCCVKMQCHVHSLRLKIRRTHVKNDILSMSPPRWLSKGAICHQTQTRRGFVCETGQRRLLAARCCRHNGVAVKKNLKAAALD